MVLWPILESACRTGSRFFSKTVHAFRTLQEVKLFSSHEEKLAYSSTFVLIAACFFAIYFNFNVN